MSNRLDQERQAQLEPARMEKCKIALELMGYEVTVVGTSRLDFMHHGAKVMHYPYSGWHTGRTITDGRGFEHLLAQLA